MSHLDKEHRQPMNKEKPMSSLRYLKSTLEGLKLIEEGNVMSWHWEDNEMGR